MVILFFTVILKISFQPPEAPSTPLYSQLHLSLRTQPNSFVIKFLEMNGVALLLSKLDPEEGQKNCYEIVKCVRSLMNNSKGREGFLR